MITNLPRQRDLWIVILLIVVGAAAIIAVRTSGNVSSHISAGAGTSATVGASPAPTETTGAAAQAPDPDSLPADTRAQFDALPAGTILIACGPTFVTYPESVIPEVSSGWKMTHPGWRVLLHGYCVDNPSAIRSFDPQVLTTP